MKDVIVLFTPIHTGTHFVRMLLESHPAIATAIGEDYRVDLAFRPGHVLAGRGMGRGDPGVEAGRDRSSERMLLDYFHDFLREDIDAKAFRFVLSYWQSITSESHLPLSHRAHHLAKVQEQFRSLGITLAPKEERYLLYRGHCHSEYEASDLTRLTRHFAAVVTFRHPLRSILTIMRREPVEKHQSLIEDYLKALKCLFALRDTFFFCTDLWQTQPERMASLFSFLGLPLSPASAQFLALRPAINKTVSTNESHGDHNYCFAFDHSPALLTALHDARMMLDDGKCHPLLAPFRAEIQATGLAQQFENLGYPWERFAS